MKRMLAKWARWEISTKKRNLNQVTLMKLCHVVPSVKFCKVFTPKLAYCYQMRSSCSSLTCNHYATLCWSVNFSHVLPKPDLPGDSCVHLLQLDQSITVNVLQLHNITISKSCSLIARLQPWNNNVTFIHFRPIK